MTRIDGQRAARSPRTPTGDNIGAVSTAAADEARRAGPARRAPRLRIGGVSADQADAFADLGLALLAAIAIVFMVMVATFRA